MLFSRRKWQPSETRLYAFLTARPNFPDGIFTPNGSIGCLPPMEAIMLDLIYLAITAAAFSGLVAYARGLARL
ncbi:hypothetical protein GCM10007989_27070 [Devosia pacifica]|uniref:Uncharacterized protein n=1 Tax=Devosia pacifica TaxID=1335967 RepID=A0A918VW06_9HYPH|nr:hypothetical protein GCM10007989_27070 [Devosia pacifica]